MYENAAAQAVATSRYPQGLGGNAGEVEAQRAISSSMTELASTCGDLESEVRRLASRIRVALPGGSPFDMQDKQSAVAPSNPNTPAPVRSQLTDQLQSRIYQLRQLAQTVSGIVERIEL